MKNIFDKVGSIVRDVIMESATPLLYHYISADNCIELLKNNRLRTCKPEEYFDTYQGDIKYINGEGVRYVSLTRNKNPKEGYPVMSYGEYGTNGWHGLMVRIEFDGTLMNTYNNFKEKVGVGRNRRERQNHFNVKPFDWAYYDYGNGGDPEAFADNSGTGSFVHNGKEWMMDSDAELYNGFIDKDNDQTDLYNHPYSQAEDRLTTTAQYIPNIKRFIRRIDILVDRKMVSSSNRECTNRIRRIQQLGERIGIAVYVYGDINSFTWQK